MRKREKASVLRGILLPVIAVIVLLCFLSGLANLSRGSAEEEMRQLETAVRRAAVACYAAEGVYPPDLAYLQEHYGIQINDARYLVVYEAIASNLMPDITVLEK